jgi:hypothetical protein
MMHNRNTAAVLVEPVAAPEVFATGVAPIEDFGSFVRLTLYADKRSAVGTTVEEFLSSPLERHVVVRITMPKEMFIAANELNGHWIEAMVNRQPTLVVSNGK